MWYNSKTRVEFKERKLLKTRKVTFTYILVVDEGPIQGLDNTTITTGANFLLIFQERKEHFV